jgi:protein-tyrosine phosphatase
MKILMVCLGNICRSPIAQGILEKKISEKNLDWYVDSAGTSGWHDGEPPDARAISAAHRQGTDISTQVSRKITPHDIRHFDLILAMDSSNYQDILRLCRDQIEKDKVHLIMNFDSPGQNKAVPDPYYDGRFDEVYALLDKCMDSVIESVLQKVEP